MSRLLCLLLLAQVQQPFTPGTIATQGKPVQPLHRTTYVQVNSITPDDRRCEGLSTDTGAAMNCNLLPAAFTDHVPIAFWPASTNAGAFSLTINGVSAPVMDADGVTQPGAGDYLANRMYWLFYDDVSVQFRPFGN